MVSSNGFDTLSNATADGHNAQVMAFEGCFTQRLNELKDIPGFAGLQQNVPDPFLTSHPQKYNVKTFPSLANSDYTIISASFSQANLSRVFPHSSEM